MSEHVRRLMLSETDKKLAGVCGGLAEHLRVDSTLVRLVFVILFLFGGGGLLAYLVCWAVIPRSDGRGMLPPS